MYIRFCTGTWLPDLFLAEKWGSMYIPEIMWHGTSRKIQNPENLRPKPFQNHISIVCVYIYKLYIYTYPVTKKISQYLWHQKNWAKSVAPPPRTLWTQCWATPEAPVASLGRLVSPCPPGCSAVAPHSDSLHRRAGQNAQDRHLQTLNKKEKHPKLFCCSDFLRSFGYWHLFCLLKNSLAVLVIRFLTVYMRLQPFPLLSAIAPKWIRSVPGEQPHQSCPKSWFYTSPIFFKDGGRPTPKKKANPACASANSGLSFPCRSIAFCISSANLPNAASSKSLPPAATGATGGAGGALKLFRLLIEKAPASAGAGGMVRYS